MKLTIFLTFSLLTTTNFAQFDKIIVKDKAGVNYNKSEIIKAKFDSVIIKDKNIVTCYKKNKIYYYNSLGKKLYKNKIENSEPFINGMAICNNRKGYYLMDNKGEQITKFLISDKPKRYNNLIMVGNDYKSLYAFGHSIFYGFESAYKYGTWLKVTYKEKHERVFKRLFRKSEIHYSYTEHVNYYNTFTGFIDFKDVDSISYFQNYTYATLKDKSKVLAKNDGSEINKNIYKLTKVNDSILCYTVNMQRDSLSNFVVLNNVKQQNIFKIKANKITAVNDYFYAHKTNRKIDILNHSGEIIKKDLTYINNINDNKFIFRNDSGQYIGNSIGNRLSDYYQSFQSYDGEFIIANQHNYYTYLSESNLKSLNIKLPFIRYIKSGKKLNFLEAFGNMMLALFLQEPIYTESGEEVYPLTKHNFINGFAIAPVNYKNLPTNYDTSYILTNNEISYNYIDTSGNFMNNKTYRTCLPFERDTTWVEDKIGYFPIDNTGNSLSKMRYSRISKLTGFYYKVYKDFKWGVIDADLNLIIPCKYEKIELRDQIIYGKIKRNEDDEQELYKITN